MSQHISQEFFNEVSSSAAKITALKRNILQSQAYKNSVRSFVPRLSDVASTELGILISLDAIRCSRMLGANYMDDTPEAFGIKMLCYKSLSTSIGALMLKQTDWPKIQSNLMSMIQKILPFEQDIKVRYPDLIVSSILGESDPDLKNQYLVLLYRWASLIAKADGTITLQEQQCLERLLQTPHEQKTTPQRAAQTLSENVPSEDLDQASEVASFDPYEELESLIGLGTVKDEVRTFINFVKVQQARKANGMKTTPVSYHCIFTGNPGTGKTTIARIIAAIYKDLGIIKGGQLVETDRSGLVGEYIGSTAIKTNKIIDKALDGVLFIDEAYALSEGGANDFGKEAIATLIKRMEDERERLVVILAGYSQNMSRFLNANPGIQSRISRVINFPDYSVQELVEIFLRNAEKYEYTLSLDGIVKANEVIKTEYDRQSSNFGNARFVRNLFERTIEHQANRLTKQASITPQSLAEITGADIY